MWACRSGQTYRPRRVGRLLTLANIDPLRVGQSTHNQDGLNDLAERTLPEIMQAAIQGTNQALHSAQRPTIDIHLPTVNEHAMGQFFQMMMIATVVVLDTASLGMAGMNS